MNPCPYTHSLVAKHIKFPIKTIVELGCNDYLYTYDLLRTYDPKVLYAFEPNPKCLRYCLENNSDSRIKFVPQAVAEHDGFVDFYGFREITGCASLFERLHAKEAQEPKVQIPCTRLDTFFASVPDFKIDFLCMDIQGAELMAMRSLGKLLESVSYIMLEIPKEGKFMHKDAPTRSDMLDFLFKNRFNVLEVLYENDWEDNVLFQRTPDGIGN